MAVQSSVVQWNVELEQPSHIDNDEDAVPSNAGWVGVCLSNLDHEEFSSSSDEEFLLRDD